MALTDKERLATLEADFRTLRRDVDEHDGSLFGTRGGGGLNTEIKTVATELRHHVKDEAEINDRNAEVLVGEDGTSGLVAGQAKDRKDLDRLLIYARIAIFFLAVVATDVTRRFIAWLASR